MSSELIWEYSVIVTFVNNGFSNTTNIKNIKQISKKKVSLENILQRVNETSATNIDIDTLRIDVDNMLRNGIIDQDYKILKNNTDGDLTLDTIHFPTGNTSDANEN